MLKKGQSFKLSSFIFMMLSTFLIVGCSNQITPLDPTKQIKLGVTSKISEQLTEVENASESANNNHSQTEQVNQQLEETPENNGIFGTWYIWIPGSTTNYYDEDTSEYATHEFTPGAEAGRIMLFEHGTYSMAYDLWDDRIVRGEWYLSEQGEINGEPVEAIILTNGPGGKDWAIAPAQDGTLRLLQSSGTWNDGSSMWQFDSELYR